jgi:hypothetical protein
MAWSYFGAENINILDDYFYGGGIGGDVIPITSEGEFLSVVATYDTFLDDAEPYYLTFNEVLPGVNGQGTNFFTYNEETQTPELVEHIWIPRTWEIGGNQTYDYLGQDCNGEIWGLANWDDCGMCTGGNTNFEYNYYLDCAGECGGDNTTCQDCNGDMNGWAYIDDCGNCVEGNTGIEPCDCLISFPLSEIEGELEFSETQCFALELSGVVDNQCSLDIDNDVECSILNDEVDDYELVWTDGECQVYAGLGFVNECGECVNEDDMSCVEGCNGVWENDGSELEFDECGVCDGDNSTCTDECGIINGDGQGENFCDCAGNIIGSGACSCQSELVDDIFISEYHEGDSPNQYIEIYNGTSSEIDLIGYELWILKSQNDMTWEPTYDEDDGEFETDFWVLLFNSDTSMTYISSNLLLDGDSVQRVDTPIIPSGQTLMIIRQGEGEDFDFAGRNYVVWDRMVRISGDEPIALFKDGVIIDKVGDDENVSSSGWTVAEDGRTKNHTLIRKSSIVSGNTDWLSSAASEWHTYSEIDGEWYFDDIFQHTCSICPDNQGDFNNDLDINLFDILILVDCIVSTNCATCLDLNQDGNINIFDIIIIVNIILEN